MRRRKKLKLSKTIISFSLLAFGFIFIFLCSAGYAYLNQSLRVGGTVTIFVPEQKDFIVTYSYLVYSTNPYSIDATVTITNISDKDVSAWEIYLDLPDGATFGNNYGSEYIDNEGNRYHFDSPDGHNDYIAVGESVEFHIQYTTDSSNYNLLNEIVYGTSSTGGGMGGQTEIDKPVKNPCENAFVSDNEKNSETNGDLEATISVNGSYSNGGGTANYTKLTVTNNGTVNSSYVVMIDIGENGVVTGCYEGTCTKEGSIVTIIPPSYSATLQPNQSKSLNYHFTIMPGHEMNLIYVGKNVDGYILACQPNYNGGVTDSGDSGTDSGNTGTDSGNTGTDSGNTDTNPPETEEEQSTVTATLNASTHWSSGQSGYDVYQIQLSVTNNGDTAISGWRVVVSNATNADPTGCWNGTCTKTGDTITFENNQNIAAGRTSNTYYQITMPVGTELKIKSVRSN